jgi:hypothetical protein
MNEQTNLPVSSGAIRLELRGHIVENNKAIIMSSMAKIVLKDKRRQEATKGHGILASSAQ